MTAYTLDHAVEWENLPLAGAFVCVAWQWLDVEAADALFHTLNDAIAWERHRLKLFGREIDAPRLSCWIGDPDATYAYSRSRFEPRPWPPALQRCRAQVEHACGSRFNSVLAQLYRDGRDAMGWHSDDEAELGTQPVIASLSLGATRRFKFRRKAARGNTEKAADAVTLALTHGSLLVMAGATQSLYRHALPRMAGVDLPRINLTFRCIDATGRTAS